MLITFIDRTSQVAIAGRTAEYRRPHGRDDLTTPGDYHLPFGKFEPKTEAARWFWQSAA